MKKILIFTALIGFLLAGCQHDNSIITPSEENISAASFSEPEWISFPSSNSLRKMSHTEGWVVTDGVTELSILDQYATPGGPHNQVTLDCSIKFVAGAVDEDVYMSWDYDDVTGIATFLPGMEFNIPAELDIMIEGLALVPGDELLVDFYYIWTDEYGVEHSESIDYDELNVDVATGTIELINGIIPHFSRFGFGK